MFWSKEKSPSPPPAEREEQFVEWLLRYGKDFEVYRKIYKSNIETYVRTNKNAILEELRNYPDRDSISRRNGEVSIIYAEGFMPLVEGAGGIRALGFQDTQVQAYAAMALIKLNLFHYILKYKYNDKTTRYMEEICGPLENIYY